jgi:hypothetical protein
MYDCRRDTGGQHAGQAGIFDDRTTIHNVIPSENRKRAGDPDGYTRPRNGSLQKVIYKQTGWDSRDNRAAGRQGFPVGITT